MLDTLAEDLITLQQSARALAELDVLNCFAERAVNLDFCRPQLSQEAGISIALGRHPVVENVLDSAFVANNLEFDDSNRMLIITGPNMGGKSTFMRQKRFDCVDGFVWKLRACSICDTRPYR